MFGEINKDVTLSWPVTACRLCNNMKPLILSVRHSSILSSLSRLFFQSRLLVYFPEGPGYHFWYSQPGDRFLFPKAHKSKWSHPRALLYRKDSPLSPKIPCPLSLHRNPLLARGSASCGHYKCHRAGPGATYPGNGCRHPALRNNLPDQKPLMYREHLRKMYFM